MVGGEAVGQGAGVAVQSGVGVSPDGVVSEERLADLTGDLEDSVLILDRIFVRYLSPHET